MTIDRGIVRLGVESCLGKLNPLTLQRNPVIFLVEIGAVLVSVLAARDLLFRSSAGLFELQASFWLWFTVLLANFNESLAEARGKAQADTLRKSKSGLTAKRLVKSRKIELVPASKLRANDLVLVEAGDLIPGDGLVVDGIAIVDESVITGESAPVIRESGADRNAVTKGTRVLSDSVRVRILANAGETLLDRMIALMEGAERKRTPNEIACHIVISGFTLILLFSVIALSPFAEYMILSAGKGTVPSASMLTCLLVCLMPVTIGACLSATSIAAMNRVMQHNILATSGKALEAATHLNTVLLDKTGTVTVGNRQAIEMIPFSGVSQRELVEAALITSIADDTPEGRSIVALAKTRYGVDVPILEPSQAKFIPFSPFMRMSGIDADGRMLRKGAKAEIGSFVTHRGGQLPLNFDALAEQISEVGGTALAVADGARALGIVFLRDVIKPEMKQRAEEFRATGIRTVMITGDSLLTAKSIAAEAGIEEFVAQATPADKLAYVKREQSEGRVIAIVGDGASDAPALAQAEVGLVMSTGATAAKEAGNMVDLDSDPTKLLDIIAIGKRLLMTRGALLTFSLATNIPKYLIIVPMFFLAAYPELQEFNVMGFKTPESVLLSALIFNCLTIVGALPLALRGAKAPPLGSSTGLSRNLFVYGLGGILLPCPCIWVIERTLIGLHLV